MVKLLSDFCLEESGKVVKLTANGKLKRRLFDMGITPGTALTLKKFAPFKDPIEVTLRGYNLIMRIDEAREICMEVDK